VARLFLILLLGSILAIQTGLTAWSMIRAGGRQPLLVGAGVPRGGGYDLAPDGGLWDLGHVRRTHGIRFARVDSLGAMGRAGVRAGDLLVRVGAHEVYRHPGAYFEMLLFGEAGQRVSLVWIRDNAERRGEIVLPDVRNTRSWSSTAKWRFTPFYDATVERWLNDGTLLLGGLLVLVLGLAIGLLRTRDRAAFLFGCGMLAFGLEEFNAGVPLLASLPLASLVVVAVASSLAMAVMGMAWLELLAVFPRPTRTGARIIRWRAALWIVLGLRASAEAVYSLWRFFPGISRWVRHGTPLLAGGDWPLLAITILSGILLVAQRVEGRGAPARRLRAVETGLAIMIIAALIALGPQWVPGTGEHYTVFATAYYLSVLGNLFLLVGLLVLAYGVVAQRVFSLRFAVRRGLQHLMLSRAVLVAEFIVLFLVLLQVLRSSRLEFSTSVPAVASLALTSAGLLVVGLGRANRPLMGAIDRRFFREACDARRVLVGLGERVAGLGEREAILERAGEAVLAALHPARLGFLTLDGGDCAAARLAWGRWQRRTAGGRAGAPTVVEESDQKPEDLALVQDALGQFGTGRLWADYPPTREEADAPLDLSRPARYELVLPVRAGTELLGSLALAVKLSEDPYSREDKELLHGVAMQVGLALKNAALVEVAKREAQQAKELEIARTVQQQLFPKALPQVAGWEFAGECLPARAVGGDYWDVFELRLGRIAVALGDVSGKGLGAALLMSNLHALVRTLLPRTGDDLGAFMREVNEHLVESSPAGMFVTLFLGILDTTTGELRYVNAGHPPGLVLCAGDGEARQLGAGGLPVGMLAEQGYEEGRAMLGPGSAVVLYSDGVTEATRSDGEMYEEERLVDVLGASRGQAATEVLTGLLAAVEAFVAGAEQADDISVLVVRRPPERGTTHAR